MAGVEPLLVFDVGLGARQVAFHPAGRLLLVVLTSAIEVRLVATGERVWRASFGRGVAGAAWAEGGRSVIVAAPDAEPRDPFRGPRIPSGESVLFRVAEDDSRRDLEVRCESVLAAAPDGSFALLDYGDGELGLFELDALRARTPFVMAERATAFATHAGALSNEGRIAVTSTRRTHADRVSRVVMWRAHGAAPFVREGNAGGEAPVAVSPNGRRVLYGNGGRPVLWHAESGTIESFEGEPMDRDVDLAAAAFSADGRRFLYGGFDRIEVHDRIGDRAVASLAHPPGEKAKADVVHAAFSPDGRFLASAVTDGRVVIWPLPT